MEYYKLPLLFSRLFESEVRDLSLCSEEESIDRSLELIITTYPGEHKYNPDFGCKIWNLDFENVVSVQRWESEFTRYITEAIRVFEPRIRDAVSKVEFFDVKNQHEYSGAVSIRKRVDIKIDTAVVSSGKKCRFYYSLYLGPLSSE
jgi:phage baseplate assembly protein W